jgi:hypothetical protein
MPQQRDNPFDEAHKQFLEGDIKGAMQNIQVVALLYMSGYFSVGWKKVQEDDVSTMEEVKKMPPISSRDLNFLFFDNNQEERIGGITIKIRGTENNPILIISVDFLQPGSVFKVFSKTYVFTELFDAEQYQKEILSFEAIPPEWMRNMDL